MLSTLRDRPWLVVVRRVTVQDAYSEVSTESCVAAVLLAGVRLFYCTVEGETDTVVWDLSHFQWRHLCCTPSSAERCRREPAAPPLASSCSCCGSVVVEALAGLLEVAVAPLCGREARLGQVLPVEGAAAQLLPLGLAPGLLHRHQVEVAGCRKAPGRQAPGQVPPHRHRPADTQGLIH